MCPREMTVITAAPSYKASGKWPLRIQMLEVTAFVTGLLLFLNEKGEQFQK